MSVISPFNVAELDVMFVAGRFTTAGDAADAGVLAFEAQRTVVLDRPELVEQADELGIALVAVGADGPNKAPKNRPG